MHWTPFSPSDLDLLSLQPQQAWVAEEMGNPDYARKLASSGIALTLRDDDHVVACAGLIEKWPGSAIGWSLIAHDAGRNMIRIVRAMKWFLRTPDYRRIEITVDTDFEAGHRMARLLGFNREGTMRAYLPDRDCDLYAMVTYG